MSEDYLRLQEVAIEEPSNSAPPSTHTTSSAPNPNNTTTILNYNTNQNQSTNPNLNPPASDGISVISFRTLTGQLLKVEVENVQLETISVRDLKNKLEQLHGIPAQFQRFIFMGREMNDDSCNPQAQISNGSCIHILLKQANNPNIPIPAQFQNNHNNNQNNNNAILDPGMVIPMNNNNPDDVLNQPDNIERLGRTYKFGRIVKMFSVIDGIFLVLWTFTLWYLAFGVILALCGYYGAKWYKPGLVSMFLIFIFASIGIRIWAIIGGLSPLFIAILVLGIIIEIYLITIVVKFIMLSRVLTDRERYELTNMANPRRLF